MSSYETHDTLYDTGLQLIRKALDPEMIRATGAIATSLQDVKSIEVRRPGFTRKKDPAVRLTSRGDIDRNPELHNIPSQLALDTVVDTVPSLLEPVGGGLLSFGTINQQREFEKGREYFIEVVPSPSLMKFLDRERDEVRHALTDIACEMTPEADREEIYWDAHDPMMTVVYCGRSTTYRDYKRAVKAVKDQLPIRTQLSPAL